MVDLVFTSENALRRSIRKKYPLENFSEEEREKVWDATFEDNKQWVGMTKQDMENYMEKEYQEEKRLNNI